MSLCGQRTEPCGLAVAYEGVMVDRCRILPHEDSNDAYGDVEATHGEGPETRCLFTLLSSSEQHRSDATMSLVTAKLRLPLGTVLDRRDRVRITQRNGRVLATPLEFAVEGEPRDMTAFLAVDLAEVTV